MARRNSRGQFTKVKRRRGSGRRSGGGATVALSLREAVSLQPRPRPRRSSPARRPVPKKRRRSYSSGASGLKGIVPSIRGKLPLMAGSAAYGFITQGKSATATALNKYLDMVPTVASIGKPATHGLLLTGFACFTSGRVRKYADALATAALQQFAHNLGAADFAFAQAATMSGDDLSGSIGANELRGDDDDY